ncbi:MAG: type II toxin-antitoxin system HicB family antitoxin [Deltaproteobacteria bacterium]|nr:type II toxin-antitoxin system HicB family antitoxin [Deltaproteobacteria bacterium]
MSLSPSAHSAVVLPGCMADGKTYQKALSNAEIIINEWVETAKELGREIPRAKGRLMFA